MAKEKLSEETMEKLACTFGASGAVTASVGTMLTDVTFGKTPSQVVAALGAVGLLAGLGMYISSILGREDKKSKKMEKLGWTVGASGGLTATLGGMFADWIFGQIPSQVAVALGAVGMLAGFGMYISSIIMADKEEKKYYR